MAILGLNSDCTCMCTAGEEIMMNMGTPKLHPPISQPVGTSQDRDYTVLTLNMGEGEACVKWREKSGRREFLFDLFSKTFMEGLLCVNCDIRQQELG